MIESPKEIQDNFLNYVYGLTEFSYELAGCKYLVGNSIIYQTNLGGRVIYIESRLNMDGKILWIVKMANTWVLGKDNSYHYEPLPSSRTEKFIELTRYGTKEDALHALKIHELCNKPSTLTIE